MFFTDLPTGVMKFIYIIHVLVGVFSFFIFSIPLVTAKGGVRHKQTGWMYVSSMLVIGFTTFIIVMWRMFWDSSASDLKKTFSFFLLFISILTLSSIWYGLRALRTKDRKASDIYWVNIVVAGLLFIVSSLSIWVGLAFNNNLLTWFPVVGFLALAKQVSYWVQKPKTSMHWWFAHMSGMYTACIGTVTAFVVVAIPKIANISPLSSILLWLGPTIVMIPMLRIWSNKYKRKFKLT